MAWSRFIRDTLQMSSITNYVNTHNQAIIIRSPATVTTVPLVHLAQGFNGRSPTEPWTMFSFELTWTLGTIICRPRVPPLSIHKLKSVQKHKEYRISWSYFRGSFNDIPEFYFGFEHFGAFSDEIGANIIRDDLSPYIVALWFAEERS